MHRTNPGTTLLAAVVVTVIFVSSAVAAEPVQSRDTQTPETSPLPPSAVGNDALPTTPEALPKVLNGAEKLWEIPVPDPVLDAPPEAPAPSPRPAPSPAVPVINSADLVRIPLQQDPVARTALNGARSNAESLTDGVGGIASPLDAAYLPAKTHPPGAGFVFGPGTIFPTLSFGASYRNSRGTNQPFQATVGGALSFALGEPSTGKTLAIDYSALARIPEEQGNNRPVDQQLAVRAQLSFTKLLLGFGLSYSGLSGVNRDVGGDTDRDLITISGVASYEISPKTSVDVNVGIPIRQFADGVDSAGVNGTGFFNFKYSPKTSVGVGLGGGILKVQGGGTQTFEQLLTRFSLASSEVLSFDSTFGVEFRDAGDTQTTTPTFGFGATWTPRLGTSLTLSADRRPQNSATTSTQNFVTTSFSLTALQRLGSRMSLQLSGGYENAEYYSLSSANQTSRKDNLYTLGAGFSAIVTKYVNATLQYAFTQNSSSLDSFQDTQAQFQVNVNF